MACILGQETAGTAVLLLDASAEDDLTLVEQFHHLDWPREVGWEASANAICRVGSARK